MKNEFWYGERYGDSDGLTAELTDLQLHKDNNGEYFLSARYRVEDEKTVREVHIPKIMLPVYRDRASIVYEQPFFDNNGTYVNTSLLRIYMGIGTPQHPSYLVACTPYDDKTVYFTETVIDEKTHEMTLDEIEKKLGYKVKIVNK